MTQVWYLLFVIGGVFGLVGSAMAYLITYREWVHHYESPKVPRKIALEAAVAAFVFLMIVALAAGFFVTHYPVVNGSSAEYVL